MRGQGGLNFPSPSTSATVVTQQLSRIENHFQQCLRESSSTIEQNFHQQLSTQLSQVHESFQQYNEVLALVPDMKAKLQHIESSTEEEVRRVKASLEKQIQSVQGQITEPRKRGERPVLRALPAIQQESLEARTRHGQNAHQPPTQALADEKFDACAFVFACLEEKPDLKLSEIEQLAFSRGQKLSQPTASRYRKQFFARGESSTVVSNESPTMKAESRAIGQ